MFNCSTNCLCPIRFATNGSTSLLNENFYFFNLIEEERIIILACPGLEPTHLSDPLDQRRTLRVEGLADCSTTTQDNFLWKIATKSCTSIETRLGAPVRDFSACFCYFTKWDPNYFEISWDHFEFGLLFTWGINGGTVTWPRRDTKFLCECWKTFHEWALLSNCLMMNLKLQNASCTKKFCLCWVLRSKVAVIVLRDLHVFGLFMNN